MTAIGLLEVAKGHGATSVVITASASQLGRMMLRLCPTVGLTAVCIVRREEQVKLLKEDFNQTLVLN